MFTPKQEKFINGIVQGLNATKSALEAGYNPNTAAEMGSENLKKPHIQAEIQRRKSPIIAKADVKAEEIIKELKIIAFTDITEIVSILNENVETLEGNRVEIPVIKYKNTNKLTAEQKKCIKSIKPSRNGIIIEFHDKEKALELLAKHLGMFEEQQEEQQVIVTIKGTEDYAT